MSSGYQHIFISTMVAAWHFSLSLSIHYIAEAQWNHSGLLAFAFHSKMCSNKGSSFFYGLWDVCLFSSHFDVPYIFFILCRFIQQFLLFIKWIRIMWITMKWNEMAIKEDHTMCQRRMWRPIENWMERKWFKCIYMQTDCVRVCYTCIYVWHSCFLYIRVFFLLLLDWGNAIYVSLHIPSPKLK